MRDRNFDWVLRLRETAKEICRDQTKDVVPNNGRRGVAQFGEFLFDVVIPGGGHGQFLYICSEASLSLVIQRDETGGKQSGTGGGARGEEDEEEPASRVRT